MAPALRFLLCLCLSLGVGPGVWAKGPLVWVALSGNDSNNLEAAEALRRSLGDLEVDVRQWQEFADETARPKLIVTVGSAALSSLAEAGDANSARVPIVAVLVSRFMLDRAVSNSRRPVTGVALDQPVARQLALLRLAAPDRKRVGVLFGPDSSRYRNEISRAIQVIGLEESVSVVEDVGRLAQYLQTSLGDSDVLLSIPDAEIFNSKTAHNILISAYRRRVPVLGYSAAFVRAGALMAVYSTPEQIARQAAGLVDEVLAGRLPAVQSPQDFNVAVNTNVARAFGLRIDEDELAQKMRRKRGLP